MRGRSTSAHDAIIAATLELLGKQGYQQLTVEGVAARAGVGKATIYRWWPHKANLVIETISHQMGPPLQPTGDSEHDVRAVITWCVEVVGGLLGEVLMADLARDPAAAPQLEDLLGPYKAAHTAILLSVAARGDLPYNLDTTVVLDLIGGIVVFRKLMNRPLNTALIDQLSGLLVTGELPRTTPPAPGRAQLPPIQDGRDQTGPGREQHFQEKWR